MSRRALPAPLALWFAQMRLAGEMTKLTMDASTVVAHRLWGPAFTDPREAVRMVAEKPRAFAKGAAAGGKALAGGKDLTAATRAALRPVATTAGRNARRLTR